MVDISKIRVGDKVHYKPDYYSDDEWKNGLVKEIPDFTVTSIRVVYNCAGDWENYKNYTSALTNVRDLYLGWRH